MGKHILKTKAVYSAMLKAGVVTPLDRLRLRVSDLAEEILSGKLGEDELEQKKKKYAELRKRYTYLLRRKRSRVRRGTVDRNSKSS